MEIKVYYETIQYAAIVLYKNVSLKIKNFTKIPTITILSFSKSKNSDCIRWFFLKHKLYFFSTDVHYKGRSYQKPSKIVYTSKKKSW